MSVPKNYTMVMYVSSDTREELALVRFLQGKNRCMMHGGLYNEYVFYFADLTDEDLVYASLKFGSYVKFIETKDESSNDIITRVFGVDNNLDSPSQI